MASSTTIHGNGEHYTRTTPHRTHTSILDPFTGKNYPKDSHTLTLWLIIIAIISFFVYIALDIFFVYLPIRRIETKVDNTASRLDAIGDTVQNAAEDVEKVVNDVEELGHVAVTEFDKLKAWACTEANSLGFFPPFCSEQRVRPISNQIMRSRNIV